MTVRVLHFSDLKKTLPETSVEPLDVLVKKAGIAYVVAVTREKCPSCEKQEPLFEKLSARMKKKYGEQVEFFRVHCSYGQGREEDVKRCLDAFHSVAFPTYIIVIEDSGGDNRETYRSLEPPMIEIERNIKTSVEIASWFKSQKK